MQHQHMPRSAKDFTERVDESHPKKLYIFSLGTQICGHTFDNYLQIWPPGLAGGPGVSALRPAGEEDQTDTDLVLADQHRVAWVGRLLGNTTKSLSPL